MLRFSVRSLLLLVALVAITMATVRSGSFVAASLFFCAMLISTCAALIVAFVGQGQWRAFAIGFVSAAPLYLLATFVTFRSERWDGATGVQRLAFWVMQGLHRNRESDFLVIANTLDTAIALTAGLLGGIFAVFVAGRKQGDDAASVR